MEKMNQENNGDEFPKRKNNISCPLYLDYIRCQLCSNLVLNACKICQVEARNQGPASEEECLIVVGGCNHAFHYHCMSRWLETHNQCPVDNYIWHIQWFGFYRTKVEGYS